MVQRATGRCIGVLTSGGDAPGMNAAIRAVTRAALGRGASVLGVRRGYSGLLAGDFVELGARAVGGIIHLGGTFLGTARCPEFRTEQAHRSALDQLRRRGVDALVVIGGNGSQAGALALSREGFPVVGVPSTIDNDLSGTDVTIGVDSALAVALEAIDRLRTTAASHGRAILVELMGRDCGYLALMAALSGGAELVSLPECQPEPEALESALRSVSARGKTHALIVVAEGCRRKAPELAEYLSARAPVHGFEVRYTTLGHVQRGGAPTCADRVLASRLGAAAVDALLEGRSGVLVGELGGVVRATPLEEVLSHKKPLDPALLALADLLER